MPSANESDAVARTRAISYAQPGSRSDLSCAKKPVVFFCNGIGDCLLALPTLRALSKIFDGRLTLICPEEAYRLCYNELRVRHINLTGLTVPSGTGRRTFDVDKVATATGPVDLFLTLVPWNTFSLPALRDRLQPTTSVGFWPDYDVVLPGDATTHYADLLFSVARLLDPKLSLEDYSQPPRLPDRAHREAKKFRMAVPHWIKVLVVHADTIPVKCWPVTRFIALLDKFLARELDFMAWIVGIGFEDLDSGREGSRVVSGLRLPLDLSMALVSEADLFVGIDSCMLHAADLFRIPGVGLFGPTSSTEFGFRLGPHRHVQGDGSMNTITVDAVLEAMDAVIRSGV